MPTHRRTSFFFFFNDTATTEIYTLSLHDALPISEAGTHWFKTYHDHHTTKLNMSQSTFDPCLLVNQNATTIVGLEIDDTLSAADDAFMLEEEAAIRKAKFLCKPCEKLTPDHPILFNGFTITISNDTIAISQDRQRQKIQLLPPDSFTKDQYVAQRA